MDFTDEDYSKGLEFVREKAGIFLQQQAEYVDPVIALQADAAVNIQQVITDLQSKLRFLTGREALQAQQTLLMVEGLNLIQTQLTTMIRLLKDLSAVSLDTNLMTHYIEINTNLIEDNTSLTEQNIGLIEQHTRRR